jgi:hypothetical protein
LVSPKREGAVAAAAGGAGPAAVGDVVGAAHPASNVAVTNSNSVR